MKIELDIPNPPISNPNFDMSKLDKPVYRKPKKGEWFLSDGAIMIMRMLDIKCTYQEQDG